jgi:hypothetical protein
MKFLFQFPCCSCFCYIKRKKSKTTEAAAKHVWSQSGANSVEIYMYTCAKVCLDIWMEWHIVQCTLFHRVKWQVVFYMNKLKYVRWLASLVFFCSFWFMDSNFLHLLFNWDKTSLCKKPAMKKLWFTNYSSQHKCRSHAGTEWRIPVKKHKQNHANGYEQKNMPNDHKVTWEEGQIEHCTKTAR